MGMEWRCKSSEKLGREDLKRCCKVEPARVTLKEAASVNRVSTHRNRIEGGEEQGERTYDRNLFRPKLVDVDPAIAR